jgi:hypothetical protein
MINPLLGTYINGVNQINDIIEKLAESSLDYIPEYADNWSIKEHIIHLVDSEINGFIRLKSIIAQPGSECYVMNEEDWTRNIRRKKEDINIYLKVFGLVRELAFEFINDEDESTWDGNYFIRTYNEKTDKITIRKWLETYNNHLKFHIEYIEQIKDEITNNKKSLTTAST